MDTLVTFLGSDSLIVCATARARSVDDDCGSAQGLRHASEKRWHDLCPQLVGKRLVELRVSHDEASECAHNQHLNAAFVTREIRITVVTSYSIQHTWSLLFTLMPRLWRRPFLWAT